MEDDMDSLFEGMVLFTPSQLSDPTPPPPTPPQPADTPPTPPPPLEASSNSASSEPLDENLFSDLTIVTPLPALYDNGHEEPELSSNPSTELAADSGNSIRGREAAAPLVARQFSRKKKRAAGLRIGYGRQDIEHEPPSPSPSVPTDATSATSPDARSKQDTLSVDSLNSQSDRLEQEDAGVSSIPTPQIDHEPLPPPPASAETKSEHESIDRDEGGEDPSKGDDDSIEAKLHRVKAEISEKLDQVRELVAALSAAKKEATRKRRKAAERVNSASARLKELDRTLEEACEAEDFETAEKVSESIAGADKEKEALVDALRDAEAECDAVDEQMQQVLEAQIAAEEECVSLLESFSMEASTKADQIMEKAKLVYEEEMEQWLSSSEALEEKKMELEIESHVVNEAREVLNNSIEHCTDDDRREKDDLFEKKGKLTDELEKLLALVKEKEKEMAENDAKIEAVEKRIAGVVAGFEEAQSNIVENYDRLQSDLSKIDLESKALAMKKEQIDESRSLEEDKGNEIREISTKCADDAKAYNDVAGVRKSLMLSILKFRENKLGLVKTEEKLSDEVQKLRQDAASARASLQELSSTKSSLQQEMSSIEQRILFIDKRLPELEAEKKVAAAARNFKEAARIAAEAKSLSTEKEGVLAEEDRKTSKLGMLEDEIKGTVNRLQEIEDQILLKEKELAVARIKWLLITAGAAKAEKDAAIELGEVEEANLLVAEAEAAESEAKRLLPVYDLKVEEFDDLPRHFVPMELVSNLGGKRLAEVASSAGLTME